MVFELNVEALNLISIFIGAIFALMGSVVLYFKVKGAKLDGFEKMKYDEVIALIGSGVILMSFVMDMPFGILVATILGLAIVFENKSNKKNKK